MTMTEEKAAGGEWRLLALDDDERPAARGSFITAPMVGQDFNFYPDDGDAINVRHVGHCTPTHDRTPGAIRRLKAVSFTTVGGKRWNLQRLTP